jgi:hypothetical protein
LRPGVIACWAPIEQIVRETLEIEIEPDATLNQPEKYRRLPRGPAQSRSRQYLRVYARHPRPADRHQRAIIHRGPFSLPGFSGNKLAIANYGFRNRPRVLTGDADFGLAADADKLPGSNFGASLVWMMWVCSIIYRNFLS